MLTLFLSVNTFTVSGKKIHIFHKQNTEEKCLISLVSFDLYTKSVLVNLSEKYLYQNNFSFDFHTEKYSFVASKEILGVET